VYPNLLDQPDDTFFMKKALAEARKALQLKEVPVGAVIAAGGRVIARGHNRMEGATDATAHAEMIAITAASAAQGNWQLLDATLYVTLEPCLMCLGAILQSRISRIVFAAADPKRGAVSSFFFEQEAFRAYGRFPAIQSGICESESKEMLEYFFKKIRKKN